LPAGQSSLGKDGEGALRGTKKGNCYWGAAGPSEENEEEEKGEENSPQAPEIFYFSEFLPLFLRELEKKEKERKSNMGGTRQKVWGKNHFCPARARKKGPLLATSLQGFQKKERKRRVPSHITNHLKGPKRGGRSAWLVNRRLWRKRGPRRATKLDPTTGKGRGEKGKGGGVFFLKSSSGGKVREKGGKRMPNSLTSIGPGKRKKTISSCRVNRGEGGGGTGSTIKDFSLREGP